MEFWNIVVHATQHSDRVYLDRDNTVISVQNREYCQGIHVIEFPPLMRSTIWLSVDSTLYLGYRNETRLGQKIWQLEFSRQNSKSSHGSLRLLEIKKEMSRCDFWICFLKYQRLKEGEHRVACVVLSPRICGHFVDSATLRHSARSWDQRQKKTRPTK